MELSDEAKILYFMNNLNDSIFMDLSTEIKQRMIAEYSRKPQAVFKVIRGEDSKRHGEAS